MGEDVITKENERILGRDAQKNNILAARVISETLKTTLGPKGMDKMLVDRAGNVIITNDGATILKEMEIEHPAAKMIVETAKTQEKNAGDGTTTAVVLAGKFLENAEKLLDKRIHPSVIINGFRIAEKKAQTILKEISFEINSKETLKKISETAMTGKVAEHLKEKLSELIIEASDIVGDSTSMDPGEVNIEKQIKGSLEESKLIRGVVINLGRVNLEMPREVSKAKIAIIEENLGINAPEISAKFSINNPAQLQDLINQEDSILRSKINKIVSSGANVVFAKKGIDEVIASNLAKKGIYALRRVPLSDLEKISKATGARIVSSLNDLNPESLGEAARVYEEKTDEDYQTFITGCKNPKTVTILLNGSSEHLLDEIERAIKDSLGNISSLVKMPLFVAGGGAVEIEICKKLKEYAQSLSGKESMAVIAYAEAFESILSSLSENAGLDPIEILTKARAAHKAGNLNHGLNLFNESISDNLDSGIIEPEFIKSCAISSATDAAIMILRIDDVIAAKRITKKGDISNLKDYD